MYIPSPATCVGPGQSHSVMRRASWRTCGGIRTCSDLIESSRTLAEEEERPALSVKRRHLQPDQLGTFLLSLVVIASGSAQGVELMLSSEQAHLVAESFVTCLVHPW